MERVPENATEVFQHLMNELLAGIELHPSERQDMMAYMKERHSSLCDILRAVNGAASLRGNTS
jgi:hypothetical protein